MTDNNMSSSVGVVSSERKGALKDLAKKTAPRKREAKMYLATGLKGVGKTYETIHMLLEKYVNPNPETGAKPRRVLIFDVNDEYGEYDIKSLDVVDIPKFIRHPKIEIRRIRPFVKINGVTKKCNIAELSKLLEVILETFAGGLLLVEDLNKFVGDSMKKDLAGTICTNRHANCDIILHYQSIDRPLPRIWENTNEVRMHHQNADAMKSKDKLGSSVELFKIAQIIVDDQYFNGNERYFINIDCDKQKIYGNVDGIQMASAIEKYLEEVDPQRIKRKQMQKDEHNRPKYNYKTALHALTVELFRKYWGNCPVN